MTDVKVPAEGDELPVRPPDSPDDPAQEGPEGEPEDDGSTEEETED